MTLERETGFQRRITVAPRCRPVDPGPFVLRRNAKPMTHAL
jgi:hypothetical protein